MMDMESSIGCSELNMIMDAISSRSELELTYTLAIAFMVTMGYGRVAIAKTLGLTERTVRNTLSYIKTFSPVLLDAIRALFDHSLKVHIADRALMCEPIVYIGFDPKVIELVARQVVKLRDHIVINARDSDKIEVIGVVRSGEIDIPGLPQELLPRYAVLHKALPKNIHGVLVCWMRYRGIIDDACLVISLAELCRSERSLNRR